MSEESTNATESPNESIETVNPDGGQAATNQNDNESLEGQEKPKENSTIRQMRQQLSEANKRIKEFEAKQKEQDFAKLSKAEREKAEFEEERKQFESERQQFEQAKKEAQIGEDLKSKGLPSAFAKALALVGDDETVLALIGEALEEQSSLIDSKTRTLLAGTPPRVSGNTGEITKEAFNKMTYAQKAKIFSENPDLYRKLK